jgi:hypothetical protein
MHCISMLGYGYDVIQEEQVKSFWGSTFMNLKKTNFVPFLSKGKHRCIPPCIGFSLNNCHYVIVGCAFTLQEFIETLECMTPFVYHLDPIMMENPLVVLCLVDGTPVEVEWQISLLIFRAFIPWFVNGNG